MFIAGSTCTHARAGRGAGGAASLSTGAAGGRLGPLRCRERRRGGPRAVAASWGAAHALVPAMNVRGASDVLFCFRVEGWPCSLCVCGVVCPVMFAPFGAHLLNRLRRYSRLPPPPPLSPLASKTCRKGGKNGVEGFGPRSVGRRAPPRRSKPSDKNAVCAREPLRPARECALGTGAREGVVQCSGRVMGLAPPMPTVHGRAPCLPCPPHSRRCRPPARLHPSSPDRRGVSCVCVCVCVCVCMCQAY